MIKLLLLPVLLATACFNSYFIKAQGTAILSIRFQHTANGKPLVLRDSSYTNAYAEKYQISRLKYYLGRLSLNDSIIPQFDDRYFLVDAANITQVLQTVIPPGNFRTLSFFLGVDSIDNCSGAQSGALDPMNGMFWTWNSGYIFFKLEGYSPQSKADINRIEHHIGGYSGTKKAGATILLNFAESKPTFLDAGKQYEMTINVNLDEYWRQSSGMNIANHALCMHPGELAVALSRGFTTMFSIQSIRELP
jgi:hypothetical protein